ncbi:MAG: glycosyltransferase [Bacteroidetes bacterium]|nr:glycosyltransferase [Bacteroidota bacterium]
MIRISNALCEGDFEVLLVGRLQSNSEELIPEKFEQKRLNCLFNKGPFFYLEYNIRLFFFLLFKSFDILGSIDDDTLLACGLIKTIRRKKLVFDAHEYFIETPELVGREFTKKIWEKIENIFIPKADLIYTVSHSIAEIYSNKFKKEVYLICNLPAPIAPTELNNFDKRTIIYQGALNLGRGIEELIDAMEFIDGNLIIVGEGDKSCKLRSLAKSKLYAHKIEFTGYIKPENLNDYTRKATIGYNVLKDMGLSYQYSLSNKFFDYIQNNIPSVSSNFVEYQKIIDKYQVGLLCDCDVQSIASTINRILNDRQLYNQMLEESKKAAEVYHWSNEKIRLKKLYENL